jgi:hypothetical protein
LLAVLLTGSAHADPMLTPITSRSYSLDLYEGVALGNSAVVAMGGATVANAFGSSGTLANPSASAVRQTTDTDRWSWDYHLDYLNATQSHDYSNSGIEPVGTTGGAQVLTFGGSVRVRDWAGAITASQTTLPLGTSLAARTQRARGAVAHWFGDRDFGIGLALLVAQFDMLPCTSGSCVSQFAISGAGLEAGATYAPRMQSFRFGAAGTTKIIGGNVTATNCDPDNCGGYTLPETVRVPWRIAVGGAYRYAQSEWNQLVGGNFRDEPAVTVVADLVVTGNSRNAYGLDAFAQNELERSGSTWAWSLRGGAEYEWLPGRLRVRGGSYWEPGRFDGVSGRLHGTFGIEVRVLEFYAWGRRRGRITLTGDLASRYNNLGISIGFWH